MSLEIVIYTFQQQIIICLVYTVMKHKGIKQVYMNKIHQNFTSK